VKLAEAPKILRSTLDTWDRGAARYSRLEAEARDALEPSLFTYLASGPSNGAAVQRCRCAFKSWTIVPRVLTGVEASAVETAVDILGRRYPTPLLLAPVGGLAGVHPENELPAAAAAARRGVPMVLSTGLAAGLRAVTAVLEAGSAWLQLYYHGRPAAQRLLDAAERAGCSAIAVTVDSLPAPRVAPDLTDVRAQYPLVALSLGDRADAALARPFTLAEFEWLCGETSLPVLAKGVLSAHDATRLLESGAAGLIVSSHGGHGFAEAIASLDALPAIREALGPAATVLFDSGIRSGSDIFKALALGADGVLIGRAWALALATGGEVAVGDIIDNLLLDFRDAMAATGCSSLSDIDRQLLHRQS